MYHYHSECRKVFWQFRSLRPGDPCPKCGKPFARKVICSCECSIKHKYISDKLHKVGDLINCPITGTSTVRVTDVSTIDPPLLNSAQISKLSLYFLFLLFAAFALSLLTIGIYIIEALFSLLFSLVYEALYMVGEMTGFMVTTVIELLPTVGAIGLGTAGSLLLYNLIYTLIAKPVKPFLQSYPTAIGMIDQFMASPPPVIAPASGQQRSYENIKDTLNVGQRTIRNQQWTIAWIVIGATIGLLICYLSIDTVEEAQEAIKKTALLGGPTILLGAVFFYAAVFFLKQKPPILAYRRGLLLAMMLGAATVCTMVLVPPLLGDGSLSEADIAIGLTINIICDVVINLFESSSEKYWVQKIANRL